MSEPTERTNVVSLVVRLDTVKAEACAREVESIGRELADAATVEVGHTEKLAEVIHLDDERGPWAVVISVCGLCGDQHVSVLQAQLAGSFRSFGNQCPKCLCMACVAIAFYDRVGASG
jgi:hypothetical protein